MLLEESLLHLVKKGKTFVGTESVFFEHPDYPGCSKTSICNACCMIGFDADHPAKVQFSRLATMSIQARLISSRLW